MVKQLKFMLGSKIDMRIITGEYKGRKIMPVKGVNIRYTSDRVKESLFSILGATVIGSRFLDLCAGSGNVGIEAISRGAESVTFVDINPACIKTIISNLQRCNIPTDHPKINVIKTDIFKAIEYFNRNELGFDIIFIDPPYYSEILKKAIQEISLSDIILDSGIVIAEHDAKDIVDGDIGKLILTRQQKYGTTLLSFYRKKQMNYNENNGETHGS